VDWVAVLASLEQGFLHWRAFGEDGGGDAEGEEREDDGELHFERIKACFVLSWVGLWFWEVLIAVAAAAAWGEKKKERDFERVLPGLYRRLSGRWFRKTSSSDSFSVFGYARKKSPRQIDMFPSLINALESTALSLQITVMQARLLETQTFDPGVQLQLEHPNVPLVPGVCRLVH
jgi:hypothetical protein